MSLTGGNRRCLRQIKMSDPAMVSTLSSDHFSKNKAAFKVRLECSTIFLTWMSRQGLKISLLVIGCIYENFSRTINLKRRKSNFGRILH